LTKVIADKKELAFVSRVKLCQSKKTLTKYIPHHYTFNLSRTGTALSKFKTLTKVIADKKELAFVSSIKLCQSKKTLTKYIPHHFFL
jgi:hypothetical protein